MRKQKKNGDPQSSLTRLYPYDSCPRSLPGVTSPLFQIDKALRVLRESASDVIEFTEQTDEFLLTLSRADSMAYSANFAGGSGKPTPPAVYIEKSRQEILDLQRAAQALSLQLKEDSSWKKKQTNKNRAILH